ncbi:hypothetical protein KP509_10G021600 [Ceratopteris richardii]|uniref:Uncharacterized protein n=1 Tax=Ceratopteris richardii TaxID=49495 RepID=A0A8T2TZE0_CERRI|nr:hypothetical protein KP509_10G021600 [Ceratopteris richardii]
MATSAFRSTTRRGCATSAASDANGVPSTPRSKRDPSPSGRGFHRRSSSVSDFSARYLSDCSSTPDFRSSRRTSAMHGGRRSVCPSDSENESTLSSNSRPRHRYIAESEDERTQKPSFSSTKASEAQRNSLRRSCSNLDLMSYRKNLDHHTVVVDKKPEIGHSEDLVEEKTIKAVSDQIKQSIPSEPPAAEMGMTDFLDSMRSEVRRAVSDIRVELEEQSMQRGRSGSAMPDEGNRSGTQGPVIMRSVADIQNEYTTKLQESEKKVRELWSQIAVEEQRCLELSKIVNELLLTPPPTNLVSTTSQAPSSGRRPPRRRNSAERQLVLESLDVEAEKYFEECVSISSFECHGDSDDSISVKDSNSTNRDLADSNAAAESSTRKGPFQGKDVSIGSDGVVLPWLKWEDEAGGGNEKALKFAKKHVSPRASTNGSRSSTSRAGGSNDQFYRSGSGKSMGAKRAGATSLLEVTSSEKLGSIPGIPLFSIDDQIAQVHQPVDVDTMLLDKIQFMCRVNNGELVLCQSLFLM